MVTFRSSSRVHQRESSTDAARSSLMVKNKNSLKNSETKLTKPTRPSVALEKESLLLLNMISQPINIQNKLQETLMATNST